MFASLKELLLEVLKVPPEPQPPAGAPGSLQIFRAAKNFYRLRLLQWGVSQTFALAGLIFALFLLHGEIGHSFFSRNPRLDSIVHTFSVLEILGVITFLLQLPFTYAATRLDFELRWYLVTDRSLRIRTGVWTMEELTMTFANIQELTVRQGPLQRLLGIADLKVRSAGGGGAKQDGHEIRETHVAYFHGVDNAEFIRDLILAHLRRQRDTGLGDPDQPLSSMEIPALAADDPSASTASGDEMLDAAKELLHETRALHAALRNRP